MVADQIDVTPDRRQRRWQEVHDRLYDAACQLFLQSDFVSTSVDDIAARADLARKTAFNHFPRKRDFISEWGSRRRDAVAKIVSREIMSSGTFEEVIRHYFDALVEVNRQHRALTIRMLMGWRESGGPFDADPHTLVSVFRDLIVSAQDRGLLRDDIAASPLASMLYGSYFGILYDWAAGSDDEEPFDLRHAYHAMLDIVIHGTSR